MKGASGQRRREDGEGGIAGRPLVICGHPIIAVGA